MDSLVSIYLDRADNELMAAAALKRLSEETQAKLDFRLPEHTTFYSSVIAHACYGIFYAAKAILLTKGIRTSSPDVHKKTYEAFQTHLAESGLLDVRLLDIYRKMVIRADELLEIFKHEKWKRGQFTYTTIPQANREPAEDSLKNAKTFVAHIAGVIKNM